MSDHLLLYIDDDSLLARANADHFRIHFRNTKVDFQLFTTAEEAESFIKDSKKNIILAIIDLWMVNKDTNTQNRRAGFVIIESLRKRFPKCFIIVVSAHLTPEIEQELSKYDSMGIISKPFPTSDLINEIDKRLKEMGVTIQNNEQSPLKD
jgi:DNA-binding NarL/FixJ family response regulator